MYDKDSASNEFLWEKVPHVTELYFHDKKFSKLLLKFSRKFEFFKNLVGSKASEDGTKHGAPEPVADLKNGRSKTESVFRSHIPS